jgi:hypothetical protein
MARSNNGTLLGLLALAIGAYLYSDPKCKDGCRTVAAHLLNHGLHSLGFGARHG